MAATRKRVPCAGRKRISSERLRELIQYNPDSGAFTRIGAARPQSAHLIGKSIGFIKSGSQADGGGYLMMSIDGRKYRGHHIAWLYMTGEWPASDIENDVRHDNHWKNLRLATRSQNIGNARIPWDSRSGIKGASWDERRKKWKAQIVVRGRPIFLGRFNTKEEAGTAYVQASIKYFGEFARVA